MINKQTIIDFFKNLRKQYNQLCKDMGVDQGGCRSCVPKYQFDENGKRIETRLSDFHEEKQS